MLRKVIFLFSFLFLFTFTHAQIDKAVVYGKVVNSVTGDPLEGCNISIKETSSGTVTNERGEFSLYLPLGNYNIQFSFVGFESTVKRVSLSKNNMSVHLEVLLKPKVIEEGEITVTAENEKSNTEIQSMEAKDMQMMPNVYNDVLRSVQVMAGVSTNNELTTGYNVRGGSFDENIIYLNGFEIYRPFLVKQGVEENQSLINPDMISGMQFYNGEFPASFGDRMSSVLEINYQTNFETKLSGTARVDLFNAGVNIKKKYKNVNISLGGRYSYPDAFLTSLQTKGDYIPSFSDVQLFADYKPAENIKIELIGIYAVNKFFLAPQKWEGNFGGFYRGDYRGLIIDYDGENEYKYTTNLAGIRYSQLLSNNINLRLSFARYGTNETEKRNTTGIMFYNEDAKQNNPDLYDYLKTRYEYADNSISLSSYRIKAELDYTYGKHTFLSGIEYRLVNFDNHIDENFYEEGDQSLLQKPERRYGDDSDNLNNFSVYVINESKFTDWLKLNLGLRYLRYEYSNENLFSPRVSLTITPSNLTKFSLGWGYYYQPPFVNELKNSELEDLKSQRAIHYALGWEQQIKEKMKFSAEVYYKDLDNLIPFYFEELKMIYVNGNTREGYSYGLDLQIDGELIEGMRSIFGYGYLNSRERDYGSTNYQRRLLDQTHTLQIFLQDKFKKHENWQSHLRFLFGSGQLFYNRVGRIDEESGMRLIEVDINRPSEYFLYFRVDMGLSASFDIFNDYKLIAVAEVLNVFNHLNYGSYDWVQVFEEYKQPYRIPRVLSHRFFNVKVEFRF